MFGCAGLAALALSCGTNRVTDANTVPAASAGDEPPPSAAAARPAAAPASEGRGRLLVKAKVAGQVVKAHARLVDGGHAIEFEAGEPIETAAGMRRLEVALVDDSALIDQPTLQLDVVVEPYKETNVNAAFPWAKVQLNLLVHGRAQAATAIKLLRSGNVVAEAKSGQPSFLISPGTYEAEVAIHGKPVHVKGLAFFESSEQVVPVAVP
jgi:hypothetical protein